MAIIQSKDNLKKSWTDLESGTYRDVSPSAISSISICPARHFINRLATSSYDTYIKSDANAYGTAVHKALEDGFNFLRNQSASGKKFPHGREIMEWINEAVARAEVSLKGKLPIGESALNHPRNYIKSVISEYGKKYLRSGGRMNLLTELPIRTLQLPMGDQAAGIMDLLLHYEDSKAVDLIDYKYARARGADLGADYMSVFSDEGRFKDPKTQIQPKVYACAIFDNRKDINDVHFTYDTYVDDGTQAGKRTKISATFNRARDHANLKADIADSVAKSLSTQREMTSLLGRSKKADALKIVAQMRKGACSPYACASCPMRYQCHYKTFVEEARQSANGEKFVDTELTKLQDIDNRDKVAEREASYKEYVNSKKQEYIKDRTEELQKAYSMTPQEAATVARSNAKVIEKSYKSLQYFRRGTFEDSVTQGAYAARSKLIFSAIDPDLPARWMTNSVRRNIYNYSAEYVETLAKSFEIGPDHAREVVLNAVFKDRETVAHLDKLMMDNSKTQLSMMGYDLDKYPAGHPTVEADVQNAMKRYGNTIDKNVADTVNGALNTEFTRHLVDVGQEKLEKYGIDPRHKNLEAITGAMIDHNLLETNPEKFLSQVAKSESFGSLLDRTRLGAPRFPVGTLIVAGMLSYIAGVDSIRSMVENKVNKLKFYLTNNDDKVDDGTHSSIYGISRRLLYSDFGSPVRKVLKRSDQVNRFMRNYKTFFKDMVTVITGREYNSELGAFKSLSKGMGIGIAEGTRKMITEADRVITNPKYLLAGGLAGFITMGVLPHIKTTNDVTREIRERNKRFKKLKQVQWSTNDPKKDPESQMRMGYKAHSPLGSPVDWFGKLEGIRTIAVDLIEKELLPIWKGLETRAEDIFTRSPWTYTLKALGKDIAERYSSGTTMQRASEFLTKEVKNIQAGEFAKKYHEIKETMGYTLRNTKTSILSAAQGNRLEEESLKRTIESGKVKVVESLRNPGKILSKPVVAAMDMASAIPSTPFLPDMSTRAPQVRTTSRGEYASKSPDGGIGEDRPWMYDRNTPPDRTDSSAGFDRDSWYDQEGPRADAFISDSQPPFDNPSTYQTKPTRNMHNYTFFGSGRSTKNLKKVSAIEPVPSPRIMSVPQPFKRGYNQAYPKDYQLRELGQASLNSSRGKRGGYYYSNGSTSLNQLAQAIP